MGKLPVIPGIHWHDGQSVPVFEQSCQIVLQTRCGNFHAQTANTHWPFCVWKHTGGKDDVMCYAFAPYDQQEFYRIGKKLRADSKPKPAWLPPLSLKASGRVNMNPSLPPLPAPIINIKPFSIGATKMDKLPPLTLGPKLPPLVITSSLSKPPQLPPLTIAPPTPTEPLTEWFAFGVHRPVHTGLYKVRVQHEPDGEIFERFYTWNGAQFFDGHVLIHAGYIIEWQGVKRDS